MLKQVASGVWTHESAFLQSQTIVVQGAAGVLLVDPGITGTEMECLARDLHELNQLVVAGFSTHPHWDHVLWHPRLGEAPRYGTARCASEIQDFLSHADWKDQLAPMLPPDIASEIPLDLLGHITGLPAKTTRIPWEGPAIRIIEHQAHAAGHAALFIEGSDVLVAGDMLSDILIPFLNLEAADPVGDYLAALQLIEQESGSAKTIITGHGSVGGADELRARIKLDRAYVQALGDGGGADDPRLLTGPNKDWLPGVHKWQAEQANKKGS